MLVLNGVSYTLPDGKLLFENISFSLNTFEKAALIGNNGIGKSTIFKIIAGEMHAPGTVVAQEVPYYVPQLVGQFDHLTIGQALRVDEKLKALKRILAGHATDAEFVTLAEDWSLEDRVLEAFDRWQLPVVDFNTTLGSLSGGERTKILLAGITIHDPKFVLLDEPTNHLDTNARRLLYELISGSPKTMLVSSHDRTLLNLLNPIIELSRKRVAVYGGNYEFYREQYETEQQALAHDVKSQEKTLRKARQKERDTLQRQQKLNSRGKGKQEKAGLPKILQNALRNTAEKSTSKIKDVHATKIQNITTSLSALRSEIPDLSEMKLNIDNARMHTGKMLFEALDINYVFEKLLWRENLNFRVNSGERIAIKGKNGSGKTTLMKIILGVLPPSAGDVKRSSFETFYIDQDYSLIDNKKTIAEQAESFNTTHLKEHEINIHLNRFLFPKESWQRPCHALSGGERMRLTICCLRISHRTPDMIALDEPTNNLDIQSVDILTSAINSYHGTIVAISHDEQFLHSINIQRELSL
jgi:ATPase subunit of ABC transporter with duplicated ATPase domains